MDLLLAQTQVGHGRSGADRLRRAQLFRQMQARKDRPPSETLESLTERLSELNKQPFQNREETRKVMAEMDRRLKVKSQTQLSLFINEQIEKGGPVNTEAIRKKAASLDIYGDPAVWINEVMEIRRHFEGGE